MYQEERLQSILEYLKKNRRINVERICSMCAVSRDTARRDLVKLEEKNAIIRTRGGAILPTLHKESKTYEERLYYSSKEKKAIGKLASSLIKNGDKIILDSSTTVQACAEFLQVDNCTVITNSINQADILSSKPGINVTLLGGQLNKSHRFLYGPSTISTISNYYVDKAFIGVVGITENGLTLAHEEESLVVKKMLQQAEQVIVLADHSKFGKNGFIRFALLSEIDLIITNKKPNDELMEVFKHYQIDIMVSK